MRLYLVVLVIGVIFTALRVSAQTPAVVTTVFETDDVVVATRVLKSPGAKLDSSSLIQRALERVYDTGGGVVFLQAGMYRLNSPLLIPPGVTLRGDYTSNVSDLHEGTVLMVYHDRGNANGRSTISLSHGSGLRGVSIWYPEQDPEAIVPYPWTIETSPTLALDNQTVYDVTIVNAYRAIKIGPEWNELHTIRNVRGTALKTAIFLDFTTDIGRLIDLDFSPDWWERTALPGAPKSECAKVAARAFTRTQGLGIDLKRSDWEYMYGVRLSGYQTGIRISRGEKGVTNAAMYGCSITNSDVALELVEMLDIGLAATGCTLEGTQHAIVAEELFTATAQFNTCAIKSTKDTAAVLKGPGVFSFQNCAFSDWRQAAIALHSGQTTVMGNAFKGAGTHMILEPRVKRAIVVGNSFTSPVRIIDKTENADIQISHRPQEFSIPDVSPHKAAPTPRPASDSLYLASAFGASPEADDNTEALQAALDKAGKVGGGTVYVEPGTYQVLGTLVVPTGVELRGSFDVPHHTMTLGTILFTHAGMGSADGTPFIQLQPNSGARGLSIWHYKQDITDPVQYPWTVRALGAGCWLLDVNLGNAYQGADFWTYPSDGHVIRYLSGCVLKKGVMVSKCTGDGWIEDIQFNPHFAMRTPDHFTNKLDLPTFESVSEACEAIRDNLDAIVVGRCESEHMRGTFAYAARRGLVLANDDGGMNGRIIMHGSDIIEECVVVEQTGDRGVEMTCTQTAPKNTCAYRVAPGFSGNLHVFNSLVWSFGQTAVIDGDGTVLFQQVNTLVDNIQISGGTAIVENVYFHKNQRPSIGVGVDCKKVLLRGNSAKSGACVITGGGVGNTSALANSQSFPALVKIGEYQEGYENAPLAKPYGHLVESLEMRRVHCEVVPADTPSGANALKFEGDVIPSSHSYAILSLADVDIGVAPDTVLSFWFKPLDPNGRHISLDFKFDNGAMIRETSLCDTSGTPVHPIIPRGIVGEWTRIRISVGSIMANRTIQQVQLLFDKENADGTFAALIDDVCIESHAVGMPWSLKGKLDDGELVFEPPDSKERIRYTLNGTTPTSGSLLYEGPVAVNTNEVSDIRYAFQGEDGRMSPYVFGLLSE